jgi:hypothetical protein
MSAPMVRIHRVWPSVAALVALVAIYAGERIFSAFSGLRMGFAVVGGALLALALFQRVREHGAASEDKKPVSRALLLWTGGVAGSMVLYALIPLVFQGEGSTPERMRAVLWALWPVVLAVSAGPLGGIELAVAPVAFVERYELRRVLRAQSRGLALGLLLSSLVLANFLAKRHEVKKDFASTGRVMPGPVTQQIVAETTDPLRVVLFFPSTNEVLEVLQDYFDALKKPANFELVVADQALAFKLAAETGVNENGHLVVTQGKTHEKIRLGEKLSNAKSALKSFDTNFAKALVKVSRQQQVAYYTQGHGERRFEATSDDPRPQMVLLRQELVANRYEVKALGVAEGLASEIPKDAALIFIIGPEKPFLPEEVATLKKALDRGVRLLICLEAEREGEPMDELLAELGLKFNKTVLANDQAYVKATQTDADKTFLHTNRYSSHASVTTMTRYSSRLSTLFPQAGYLEKLEKLPPNTRVDVVVNALDGTFNDLDRDLVFDGGDEKRSPWGLAAAVTRTASSSETRAFVISDADVFTDKYIRFQGNPYLIGDIIYWLRDVKEPVVPTVTEEDVRIVHKKDEDALWFYSTTIGVPALVAVAGVLGVRRRRRR